MRTEELKTLAIRHKLDAILVCGQANIRALTGVNCDNAVLLAKMTRTRGASRLPRLAVALYTDFRYVPMVHRVTPELKCRDLRRLKLVGRRIGYESSIPHAQFLKLRELASRGATFVDLASDLLAIRAVKTPEEISKVRAAERLVCQIWRAASSRFKPGMTERDMARLIQKLMIEKGEGEAFTTIVCIGPNAAECHHEPDETVWNGRDPVLVDMGVRFGGVCSDLTRNLVPDTHKTSLRYRQAYALVKKANRAAIAAAKPGMTGKELDRIARSIIKRGGFGRYFGHSLGHGVGYEIHESPTISPKSTVVLKPGMCVTIEPGIYLEGLLGVRIEDLILITETGCEVLSD